MSDEPNIKLVPGTSHYERAMKRLREEGCTCKPKLIEVRAEDYERMIADKTLVPPLIVDHQDDCALSLATRGMENVRMVVGGDGGLIGLVLNDEGTHITGLIPGTEAWELGMEEASRRSGIPIDYKAIERREQIRRQEMQDNPLDRRASNEQAEALLVASNPALITGATVISTEENETLQIERQLAGYVEVDEKGEFGQEIIARWQEVRESKTTDNWTRWTLIDSGPRAKIILEIVDVGADVDPKDEEPQIISFDYPQDRDALLTAGGSGWLLIRAGSSFEDESGFGTKIHPKDSGENSLLISISTGAQVLKMIEIMDAKNPNMRKNTMHEIMRSLDVAQETDPEWLRVWNQGGGEQLKQMLQASSRPLAAAQSVFASMAIRHVMDPGVTITTQEVADATDIERAVVERLLHGTFQEDNAWAWGHQREDGEWEWALDIRAGQAEIPTIFEGHNLLTADGRMQAARKLLADIGVEVPIEEVSPAMAFFRSMVDFGQFEAAFMSLLRKPPPVWASAKGFAKTYEQVMHRARLARKLGMQRSDQLTFLHLHLGQSLQVAHVLVMDSAQVNALPELSAREQIDFARHTPLAFDPLFIDFSGDDQLPGIDSEISFEGEQVKVLGAMVNSYPDTNVLFITPIFYYGNPTAPIMAIALGTLAINKSDIANYEFGYVLGSLQRFNRPAMTLIAHSEILDKEPQVSDEYKKLITLASERVIGALYLLEAANVEMVPRELPRREKKRQEKRGWKIPLVVRVDRPSRRTYNHSGNGTGQSRNYSHQFEVIGHYNHVTHGAMVRCIVCNGKQVPEFPCPRCGGTGLDPEKVKPCTRIDVKTGELTCPNGCRKIWIPPYWKGPEDKPMIIKTRKIA
jgi:hypothetical protein